MSKKKRIDMTPLVPKLSSNGEAIVLTEEDLNAIMDMQAKIVNLKVSLAEAYVQSKKHEDTLKTAIETLEGLNTQYLEEAKKIARGHGVDIDAPNQGQWNLDLAAKTLSKVG
jgi:hypothetical protein